MADTEALVDKVVSKDPRHFDAGRGTETGMDESWKSDMARSHKTYQHEDLEDTKQAGRFVEDWQANKKRTYDAYQHAELENDSQAGRFVEDAQLAKQRNYFDMHQESIESIRSNRRYVDKVLSDAQQADNQRQVIANQALQNAVETANMVGKQSLNANQIAVDRQWNNDEVASLTAKTGVQQDALATQLTKVTDAFATQLAVALAATLKDIVNPTKTD